MHQVLRYSKEFLADLLEHLRILLAFGLLGKQQPGLSMLF